MNVQSRRSSWRYSIWIWFYKDAALSRDYYHALTTIPRQSITKIYANVSTKYVLWKRQAISTKAYVYVIRLRSESERQRSCLCSDRAMDNVPIDRFACFENGNYKRIVSINVSVTITHLPSSNWHREKSSRKTVLNKKHRRITAIMFAANAVLRQLSGRK